MMIGERSTPAKRAAAAVPVDHDLAEAALAVCLLQPSFRQPESSQPMWSGQLCVPQPCLAIHLLAVSKRLRALVADCCAGALPLHAYIERPVPADSLATWLSLHGALLAELELELQMEVIPVSGMLMYDAEWSMVRQTCPQQQHPAVRVAHHVPGSLARLVLRGFDVEPLIPQQAAALAAALQRPPSGSRLSDLELPQAWRGHEAAAALGCLASLSQLTRLVAWLPPNPEWLPAHALPAQLARLELREGDELATCDIPWLALEAAPRLTSLRLHDVYVDGRQLPRGLQSLAVADVADVVPLLPLAALSALTLEECAGQPEVLERLSELASLAQLSVTLAPMCRGGDLEDAVAALRGLPVTQLSAPEADLTAGCLAHLGGACTRLRSLELRDCHLAAGATCTALAAALAQLAALERLRLNPHAQWQPSAWTAVCKALARLPSLTECDLSGAHLGGSAAELAAVTQLQQVRLVDCCLDDDDVLALCGSLPGLVNLSVADNRGVTDACLPGVASLRRLRVLNVSDTCVTEDAAEQLAAARPSLHVVV